MAVGLPRALAHLPRALAMLRNRFRPTLHWLLRASALWLALHTLTPAPPPITFGELGPLEPGRPVVCVHTRLTDEVDEWKVQRTLQLVREMGARTIVEFFPWPYTEPVQGHYDWRFADRIMQHAEDQELTVIARLGLVPAWARPPVHEKVTTLTYLRYDAFEAFAAYVGAFVARYGERLGGVIIWNEPNLAREWGDRGPDPEAYVELLRLAYEAAHAANPAVRVLAGALAPTLEPEGSGSGMHDVRFLERMYRAGAAPHFDALAAHTYGFTEPPDAAPHDGSLNFRRVELLRAVMDARGDSAKPVVITESGWSDDPLWTNAVRPGQRVAYTLTAFDMVEGWPWAEQLCLWHFRQPLDSHNRRDAYFALVSSDFLIKPLYQAVETYGRGGPSPAAAP